MAVDQMLQIRYKSVPSPDGVVRRWTRTAMAGKIACHHVQPVVQTIQKRCVNPGGHAIGVQKKRRGAIFRVKQGMQSCSADIPIGALEYGIIGF